MNKRIIRINASALKKAACYRNFWLTAMEGYKSEINSVQIEFGSAVHLFVKTMFDTNGHFGDAINAAKDYFDKTPMIVPKLKQYLDSNHLVKVCIQYWQWLQDKQSDFEVMLNSDGKPAIELTFSNKFYEDDNCIVYFEGTIDMLGKFKGQYGQYAIADHKTTSSWDKEEYLDTYDLSTQLKFYHYNLLLYGKLNPDSSIAHITDKLPVGAFIYGVFLNGKDKIEFERSRVIQFSKIDVVVFNNLLTNFVKRVVSNVTELPEPEGFLNGACNGVFGKCGFFNVCRHGSDIISMNHVLKNNYIKTEYLPLRNSEEKS